MILDELSDDKDYTRPLYMEKKKNEKKKWLVGIEYINKLEPVPVILTNNQLFRHTEINDSTYP